MEARKAANEGWKQDEQRGITIGMALAAAILARDFRLDNLAAEIAGTAGLDAENIGNLGLDDYDLAPLRKIL